MIVQLDLSGDRARHLIQKCFDDLVQETDAVGGFVPRTREPHFEIDEQREMARERISDLRAQTDHQRFADDVLCTARRLLEPGSLDIEALPEARRIDLLNGVARAMIEQQNLFLLRLEDRLARFEPSDPLFLPGSKTQVLETLAAPTASGQKLGDCIATYLAASEKRWRPKTHKQRKWQLGYLAEHLGADRPITSITPEDVRGFRDCIRKLRANHGYSQSQGFREKQTENVDARIATKTATVIFEPCKAFLRWAKSEEGLIASNPAEDIRLVIEKRPKGERSRRPFTEEELVKLFTSPLFAGSKSPHRRFDPGTIRIFDAKFWLPILGFYTGARLGELVQLYLRDVIFDGPIPHIDINEKSVAQSDHKFVKSDAGVRAVPLHPDLIELGFLDFVRKRKRYAKPTDRLFREVDYGCDGQPSTEFSKFFRRLTRSVGLGLNSGRRNSEICFHSFRHGIEDALRDAHTQKYVIDAILGHADGSMGGVYGKGVSLEARAEAVAAMKLPARLTGLVKFP